MEKKKQTSNNDHASKTSPAQLSVLLAFMEKERGLTPDKSTDQHEKQEDQKMWSEISDVLNRIPGSVKSAEQWQKAWRYIEFKTWTKYQEIQRAAASNAELTEFEKRVVALADWEDMTDNLDNGKTTTIERYVGLEPKLGFKSTTSSSPFTQFALDKPITAFGSTVDIACQPTTTSLFSTKTWDFGQQTALSSGRFESCRQSAPTTTNGLKDVNLGTSIAKYEPTNGTDMIIKYGLLENINTKIYCISAMKEYQHKSLEELRFEDYLANRKGRQYAPNPFEVKPRGLGLVTAPSFGRSSSTNGLGTFGKSAPLAKSVFGRTGTSVFCQPANVAFPGSSITKYQPTIGTYTTIECGTVKNIPTKMHSITAMKAYEHKLFEEVRMEDYLANRKATQADATGVFDFPFSVKPRDLFQFGQASAFGQSTPTSDPRSSTNVSLLRSTVQPTTLTFGQESVESKSTARIKTNAARTFRQPCRYLSPREPFTFSKRNTSQRSAHHPDGDLNTGAGSNPFECGVKINISVQSGSLSGISQQQQQKHASVHDSLLSKITTPYGDNPIFKDFKNDELTTATYPSTQNVIDNVDSPFRVSALSQPSVVRVKPIGCAFNMKSLFDDLETFDVDVESFKLKPQAKNSSMPVDGSTVSESSVGGIKIPAISSGPTDGSTTNESPQLDSSHSDSIIDRSNLENIQPDNLIADNNMHQSPESQMSLSATSENQTPQAGLPPPPSSQSKPQSHVNLCEHAAHSSEQTPKDNIVSEKTFADAITTQETDDSEKTHTLNLSVNSLTQSQSELDNCEKRPTVNSLQTPLAEVTTGQPNSPRNQDTSADIQSEQTSSVGETKIDNTNLPKESARNLEEKQQLPLNAELGLLPSNTLETIERLDSCRPFTDLECTVSANLEASGTVNSPNGSGREHPKGYDHPTGITLKRLGYYTVPSMDDLKLFLAKDGSCVVPYFEVGRTGYGNVYFDKEINVAGLNLDEIVYFRKHEIIMYPDDDKTPPIGQGLNREALVTLYHVWPLDMCVNEPIKDTHRLVDMGWENKLRSISQENGQFIKYIPETGTWIYRVKHFSKQGFST